MANANQYTTTFSLNKGEQAESRFEAAALRAGYAVRRANDREERKGHFDFWITKRGKSFRVEVKSQKAFSILDPDNKPTKDFVLVEFLNVSGGRGWVNGEADIIALEHEGRFLTIGRGMLKMIAEYRCNYQLVDRKEKMLYNSYRREGRQDHVTAVLISDIEKFVKILPFA